MDEAHCLRGLVELLRVWRVQDIDERRVMVQTDDVRGGRSRHDPAW
jgi:hypothetical protein